jgi:dTDP-glucose 4,6-dehydratase
MKLLITGGLGFIGSNFILFLIKKFPKFEIINLDAEFHGSNKESLEEVKNHDNYQFVKGNINDSIKVDKLVSDCDTVINFAAESFVDRSIANAKPFLNSNIDGVFTLLESIKKFKKKFLQISTDEVFGSLKNETALETFPYNPSSPYAATKASAEMLVNSYHITYDCDTIITRCTNNYGPRQSPEKLIPKIILLAEKNKKIPVYGNGKNLRDWLYVDDHCEAILSVLEKGKTGQSYNVSANNEIDNLTIIDKILSIMGKSDNLIKFVEDRPGHDFRYSMNSDKLRNELGWKPKIKFDDGLKNTVDWYMSNSQWWNGLSENLFVHTPWKE